MNNENRTHQTLEGRDSSKALIHTFWFLKWGPQLFYWHFLSKKITQLFIHSSTKLPSLHPKKICPKLGWQNPRLPLSTFQSYSWEEKFLFLRLEKSLLIPWDLQEILPGSNLWTDHHSCSHRWTSRDLSSRSLCGLDPRAELRSNVFLAALSLRGGTLRSSNSSSPGTWWGQFVRGIFSLFKEEGHDFEAYSC